MLRSMIIGLAIAALLQVGVHVAPPTAASLAAAARQIDWIQLQSNALLHLISDSCTFVVH